MFTFMLSVFDEINIYINLIWVNDRELMTNESETDRCY